jgi:hypothetical protein
MRRFCAALGLGAVLLGAGAQTAAAHTSQTGQDYTPFRRPDGTSCCNNQDCRPVQYQMMPDGRVYMYPDGRVILVPPHLVMRRPSDDGNAHWCGIVLSTGDAATFCAILPPQSM